MEEILASIRRIIADDQSLPSHGAFREPAQAPPAPVEVPAGPPETPAAPVHVLHPEPTLRPAAPEALIMPPAAHGAIAAPQFASPAGPHAEPVVPEPPTAPLQEPEIAEAPPAARAVPQTHVAEPSAAPPYFAEPRPAGPEPQVDETYDAPLGYDPTPEPVAEPETALFSAATDHSVAAAFNMLAASRLADNSDELLSMTREMIRPILKAWLDDNLPSMVERLVRAEIERVSRGGR